MTLLNTQPPAPVSAAALIDVRDTSSMRQFLIAGMKDVMQGSITTWQAKAACNFAQQIYNVTALEVKVMLAQEKLKGKPIVSVSFDGGCTGSTSSTGTSAHNGVAVAVAKQAGSAGPNAHTSKGRNGHSIPRAAARK